MREEEHVDVENMEHRHSQHADGAPEPETCWWQKDVTHKVRDDDGSPRTEQRRGRGSGRRSSRAEYVARHRAVPLVVVPVSLISVSGSGSVHSPESGSSQAGHRSSEPCEGGASIMGAKRTPRKMARAGSRWSDEELR